MPASSCNGICSRIKSYNVWNRKYSHLPKCSSCEIRIDTDDLRCPCCNRKLSRKGAICGVGAKIRIDAKPRY